MKKILTTILIISTLTFASADDFNFIDLGNGADVFDGTLPDAQIAYETFDGTMYDAKVPYESFDGEKTNTAIFAQIESEQKEYLFKICPLRYQYKIPRFSPLGWLLKKGESDFSDKVDAYKAIQAEFEWRVDMGMESDIFQNHL